MFFLGKFDFSAQSSLSSCAFLREDIEDDEDGK